MKKALTGCLTVLLLAWAAEAVPAAEGAPSGLGESFGVVVSVPLPSGGVLYFEAGRWYRQQDGTWQGAASPEGPWVLIPQGELPPAVIEAPQLKEALPQPPSAGDAPPQ